MARTTQLIGVGALVAMLPCCRAGQDSPQTGSESHFLKHCSNACGEGLVCLFGACSKTCTANDECGEFGAAAQCMPSSAPSSASAEAGAPQIASCEARCVSASDCVSLGPGYRCEGGVCRTGESVCPTPTLSPGESTRSVVVGNTTRTYTLHVPAAYTGAAPVPLVLDFHAMALGPQREMEDSGYRELSDEENFIVAWPLGTEISWNLGPCCTESRTVDDYAFARAVVRQLSTDACIDPRRVYAVGFSMGGGMAYYLGCTAAEVFAAVAASSMDLLTESELPCEPSRPIAEISFRAIDDPVVPYEGGPSSPPGYPERTANLLGAVGTFQRWAELDRCTGAPREPDSNGCSTYDQCQAGVEVTLCTSQQGGQFMGPASVAWNMLKRHPMP